MQSTNTEFLEKLNRLSRMAGKGQDNFPDDLCEEFAGEFDFQSMVLFRRHGDEKLLVLGRSSSARRLLMPGQSMICNSCCLTNNNNEPCTFTSSADCDLQISEFVLYEGCIQFSVTENLNILLKAARKTSFTKSDIDELTIICGHISILLEAWSNARGGLSVTDTKTTTDIINSISQELRTPANSIIGFASLLSEDNLTPLQSEYVNTIKNNAQNLLMLVNDIIDAARIDSGKIKESKSVVELKPFIADLIRLFSSRIEQERVEIVTDIDQSLPSKFILDQQRLKHVMSTLISNSIKLSENGRVSLKAFANGNGKLNFKISDSGRALPSEKLRTLFEPFVFDNYIKSPNGSGLSLTLTRKYVELMGGTISADSTTGRGTCFNFSVNAEAISEEVQNGIEQLPAPEPGKNTVLVIEDDYATSKLLSSHLIKWGYKPTMVNNAEQTLNVINNEKFLAVILDIALPNANGLELLQKIHLHPNTKNTPVIVCSVEADQQKAFMMGAVEYFQKPIRYSFLVEVLQNYRLKKDANILCVDDDLPTLNLIKEAIQSAGYNPVAENVSARVMDRIKGKNIDLAIVDLDMPYPNGFELIKLIKSDPAFSRLPIIIYTGKENFSEDLKSIDGLFEELLSKRSTNIEDLAQTINDMINRYDTPTPVQEIAEKDDDVVKILLAEDYKHSQIIVTRLLKKNGFENVVVVENGYEAYELTKSQKFDLILMDMQMPVMNGFEATEKIRLLSDYRETPIIALTAFAMKGDREKCLDAGATDYIPKPIDSKEFIEKIKYYTNVKVQ